MYLIDPAACDTRHIKINAILHDVTIEDVLHWAAYQFGFTRVNMVKPTNTIKYSNLVIPPMQSIATLFPYLQQKEFLSRCGGSRGRPLPAPMSLLFLYEVHLLYSSFLPP